MNHCLITRGHIYYFRRAIPKKYWWLANSKEICYSLQTDSRQIGLIRWHYASSQFHRFWAIFEEVFMKLHNNKLFLDETDVDAVLMQEVKRTHHILNEDYDKIEDGSLQVKDIELYSATDKKKNPIAITNAIRKLVEDYLLALYKAKNRNVTVNDIYNKVRALDGNFIPTEPDENGYDWYNSLSKHLNAYENYLRKKVVAIKEGEAYAPSNPKVESLIKQYNTPVATQTTIHRPDTYWEDVFDNFFKDKQNRRGVSDSRKEDNRQALKVCFTLLQNKPLNKLQKKDCNLLADRIYQSPRGGSAKRL